MVEYNAHGLHAFFTLLKNLSLAFVRFMKDWAFWVILSTFEKIKKLLQLLRQNPKVICIEVSEYNPDLDRDNQALHTTLDVIKSIF